MCGEGGSAEGPGLREVFVTLSRLFCVAGPSQSVAGPSQSVTDPSQSVMDSSQSVAGLSKVLRIRPKCFICFFEILMFAFFYFYDFGGGGGAGGAKSGTKSIFGARRIGHRRNFPVCFALFPLVLRFQSNFAIRFLFFFDLFLVGGGGGGGNANKKPGKI